MLAEFEVEIGADAPLLVVPWQDDTGALTFIDLRENPALVDDISESRDAAMRNALLALNSGDSPFMTGKCDLWTTQDLYDEEAIFECGWKHASYIDLLWHDPKWRSDYEICERTMRDWVRHLRLLSAEDASVSIILRVCEIWREPGFYWTIYVNGYGDTGSNARDAWSHAIASLLRVVLENSRQLD
jgi:hypothetical protein